jgi:hypothetical protein
LYMANIASKLIINNKIYDLYVQKMPKQIVIPNGSTSIEYTNEKDLTSVTKIAPTETVSGDILLGSSLPIREVFKNEYATIRIIFKSIAGKVYSFDFKAELQNKPPPKDPLMFPNSTMRVVPITSEPISDSSIKK